MAKAFKPSTTQWIIIASIIFSTLLIIAYILFFEQDIIFTAYLSVAIIGVLIFPVSFYEYSINSKIRVMEEQFPMFLKDLADNVNAGLSMTDAIRTVSKNDYKAFNSEIKKLSNQMSWGVSFEKSLMDIIKSLRKSMIISRGLSVLLQAFRSGGEISPIMNSVAESTIILQNVQKDQESQMLQQVSIIYMIQLVFLGIIIIMYKVLIPITTGGAFSLAIGSSVTDLSGIQGQGLGNDYYKGFFFLTLVIQSACNGLVAGYTKNSSIVSGIRHIAIMLLASILLFSIFVLPKELSITASSETYSIIRNQEFTVIGRAKYDDANVANEIVEIILADTIFYATTSSDGEFRATITAPDQRGGLEGIVRINHDGKTAQTAFTINVR